MGVLGYRCPFTKKSICLDSFRVARSRLLTYTVLHFKKCNHKRKDCCKSNMEMTERNTSQKGENGGGSRKTLATVNDPQNVSGEINTLLKILKKLYIKGQCPPNG